MCELFHKRVGPALSEGSSWAAISTALVGTATQLPAPWSYYLYAVAGVAAVVAVLLKDKAA